MKYPRLMIGLATILVAGLGLGVLWPRTPEASYLTAPVERGDLRTTLTATGTLDALTTVKVSSQLSGRIAEVLVDFNDSVRKDQPIAKLDPELFEADVRRAEAALDSANARVTLVKAALAQAEANLANVHTGDAVTAAEVDSAKAKAELTRRDFERKQILAQGDTLSQSANDRVAAEYQSAEATLRAAQAKHAARKDVALSAEASLNMAKANVQVAEAAVKQQVAILEQARVNLERTVIRSPIDGEVVGRNVDPGQTVATSLEAPTLVTIAEDHRHMEVLARVDEADIGRIQVGQSASFAVSAYPGRRFGGTIKQIRKDPNLVQNVVTYTVVLATENEDLALLPGMTTVLQIEVEHVHDVLKVSNAALRFTPPVEVAQKTPVNAAKAAPAPAGTGGALVWVLDAEGNPSPVRIAPGRSDATATELVAEPLSPGQAVIVGTAATPASSKFFGFQWGF
jgi:HlyD family secretion protein